VLLKEVSGVDHADWFQSRQGKDIVQKVLVQVLADAAPAWYGLAVPPITAALPTHLPQVSVRESVVDAVFRTADGSLLHFEFQSTREPTLYRFLDYAARLVVTYQAPVQVAVIYVTAVAHPPTDLDGGALRFHVHNIVIPERDGTAIWQAVCQRAAAGGPWSATDLMNLAYGPFMRHPTLSTSQRARQAAQLAVALPSPHGLAAVAMVAGLTASFLTTDDVQYVKEVLRMSPLLRELEQEAIAKGRQEGLQAGRQEGRQEGRAELLLDLLRHRFGAIPDALREQVAALTTDAEWERVGVAVALAPSLEEIAAILAGA